MTRKTCWKCGKRADFDGEVEGIKRTICCESCCLTFTAPAPHLYAGSHRVTQRCAVGVYDCTLDELDHVSHCVMRHFPSGRTSKLFLGAEIRCLADRRTKAAWKKRLRRKYADVQRRLGVRLNKLDPVMRAYLLDDYGCRWGESKTTLEQIEKRLGVLHRVQLIRKRCSKAHPKAAFDFCLSHPGAGPEQFEELKAKMRKAFRVESDRIMKHIPPAQRNELLDTPLKECAEQFEARDKKAWIRTHLQRLGVSAEEATEIVDHPACQLRIEREDDEKATARRLLRFWKEKDNVKRRRENLCIAGRHGLSGWKRSPALPVKMYIYGTVDADPLELSAHLFIAGNQHFPQLSPQRVERVSIAVAKFEEYFYKWRLSYSESVVYAIKYGQCVPLPDVENVRDTFDYKALATGFWSDKWYKL